LGEFVPQFEKNTPVKPTAKNMPSRQGNLSPYDLIGYGYARRVFRRQSGFFTVSWWLFHGERACLPGRSMDPKRVDVHAGNGSTERFDEISTGFPADSQGNPTNI
jgi:hypothetical protein